MKYTQEEILSKINTLNKILGDCISKRKAINQEISSIKKQIVKWEEFDKHQLKAF